MRRVAGDAGADGAPSVCAVVVTRDRRELLEQCLGKLRTQSLPPDEIVVVDNASSDGTAELLASSPGVTAIRLPENAGGAGGFNAAVKAAYERGHDWIWLLDDDTFPEPGCLEALVAAAGRAPARPDVLASVVRWRDGMLHPINRGWLRWNRRAEFVEAARVGLVPLRSATFVSVMVSRDAVRRHGLPRAHYFIWVDDIEYTARLLRDGTGYMVTDSVAVHWTPGAHSTVTDSRERFYYFVRNQLWMLRSGSFRGVERASIALNLVRSTLTYLRGSDSRLLAVRTVARGVRDGLGPEPR
jgi:GT2 family glycosyltransferase